VGDVVNSVGYVLAAGKLHVGREGRAIAMTSGERYATAGSGNARAEDDAALYRVAERELRIIGRAFAGIAQGCESVATTRFGSLAGCICIWVNGG